MLVPGISQVPSGQSYVRVSAHTDIIEPFYGKFGVLKMNRLELKERTDYSDHSSHSPESVFRIYHVPLSAGYWRYSYPSVALTSP